MENPVVHNILSFFVPLLFSSPLLLFIPQVPIFLSLCQCFCNGSLIQLDKHL